MNRKDIVAIDDEFPVLYTIQAILEEKYSEIETFTDPEEAVKFITQAGCRVVITDLSMPKMDGLEVLDAVLAHDQDIQVVMLTAHGSEKVAVEAMEKGAFYYITKPFDPEELKLIVKKGFQQYNLRKEILYDQELARTLQKNLLPQQPPSHPDFQLSFKYVPGGIVGGDYFDFLFLPDGSLGIFIADAMGHGVSSAMIMAMLKIAFLNTAPLHHDPARLLESLNDQFLSVLHARSYFTAFYAIIRNDPYRMIFSSAAHPFPILFRKSDDRIIKKDIPGMAIGLFPNVEYQSEEISLEKDDHIFFYTDGILDLKDAEDFFIVFQNHFCECVRKNTAHLLDNMLKLVVEGGYSGSDDITMVLFKY